MAGCVCFPLIWATCEKHDSGDDTSQGKRLVRSKGKSLEERVNTGDISMESYELKVTGENPCAAFAAQEHVCVCVCLVNRRLNGFWEPWKSWASRHSRDDSAWETSTQCQCRGRFVRGKPLPASELHERKQWLGKILALWIGGNKNVLTEKLKGGFGKENLVTGNI